MTIDYTTVDEIFKHSHLFEAYANESKGSLVPEVNEDKKRYLELEDQCKLFSVGAFEGTEMVGFLVFFLHPMLHYNKIAATMESAFVLKEYRKFGTGAMLFKEAEQIATKLGAVNFFISAPKGGSLSKVACSFGYKETNITFTKSLI
jgi:GNAT superfamily N-acetyltransferase